MMQHVTELIGAMLLAWYHDASEVCFATMTVSFRRSLAHKRAWNESKRLALPQKCRIGEVHRGLWTNVGSSCLASPLVAANLAHTPLSPCPPSSFHALHSISPPSINLPPQSCTLETMGSWYSAADKEGPAGFSFFMFLLPQSTALYAIFLFCLFSGEEAFLLSISIVDNGQYFIRVESITSSSCDHLFSPP